MGSSTGALHVNFKDRHFNVNHTILLYKLVFIVMLNVTNCMNEISLS